MKKTLDDVLLVELKTFKEPRGNLTPIESDGLMKIKRIFYTHNVPKGELRGQHSHKKPIKC